MIIIKLIFLLLFLVKAEVLPIFKMGIYSGLKSVYAH